MTTPTDPNVASELQRLREKCARYEAVLSAIATMSTRDGDILTKMSLINAVSAAKDALGLSALRAERGQASHGR